MQCFSFIGCVLSIVTADVLSKQIKSMPEFSSLQRIINCASSRPDMIHEASKVLLKCFHEFARVCCQQHLPRFICHRSTCNLTSCVLAFCLIELFINLLLVFWLQPLLGMTNRASFPEPWLKSSNCWTRMTSLTSPSACRTWRFTKRSSETFWKLRRPVKT